MKKKEQKDLRSCTTRSIIDRWWDPWLVGCVQALRKLNRLPSPPALSFFFSFSSRWRWFVAVESRPRWRSYRPDEPLATCVCIQYLTNNPRERENEHDDLRMNKKKIEIKSRHGRAGQWAINIPLSQCVRRSSSSIHYDCNRMDCVPIRLARFFFSFFLFNFFPQISSSISSSFLLLHLYFAIVRSSTGHTVYI